MNSKMIVKRQDLTFLSEVARNSHREILPTKVKLSHHEVKRIMESFRQNIPKVKSDKDGKMDPKVLKTIYADLPVCGVMDRFGVPIHPPGVSNSQGKVTVCRKMGGVPGLPKGLKQIVEVLGEDVLETKMVYTGGQWDGFLKRISQQMGRKTVPVRGKMTLKAAIRKLDELMPRLPNKEWPCVHGDFFEDLTTKIKITMNASAGPPYHVNKGECIEQILDTTLPMVIKAIKEGTLDRLQAEHPEFFLCELKNKMDRYEKLKLSDKTRPYVAYPAHWAFLFSIMAQGFQETLVTFEKKYKRENEIETSNAYGFSSSNGGLKAHYEWMKSAKRRGKVVAYGDDGCLVIKHKGKIYRIDPDFKQMDGSLDFDDISLTIEWILSHMERDAGEELPFWRTVGDVWKTMATQAWLIVDGKTIYQKVSKNGLLTGVPGTTLFDTVKAVWAWNEFLDDQVTGVVDFQKEAEVAKYMAKKGLVLKEGTWNPEPIPEAKPGVLITDHKFLGVQMLVEEFRGENVFVPTIPYSDAVEMLVTQKDNPFEKQTSTTSQQRTLFDRMRGLMITVGFTIPEIQAAIHHVVNSIPAEIVIMQTQMEKGARPDHITLQDFDYPDSSGFPTRDFCLSLYSGGEREGWMPIFPDLVELLEEMKDARKALNKRYQILLKEQFSTKAQLPIYEERKEPPLDPEYNYVGSPKRSKMPTSDPNVRSKIVRVQDTTTMKEEKYMPTLGETLKRYLESIGSVSQVGTLCDRFSIETKQLFSEAERYGIYLTGTAPGDLASLYPIVTPMRTRQEDLVEKWEKQRLLVNKGSQGRANALKAVDRLIETAPQLVALDHKRLSGLDGGGKTLPDDMAGLFTINPLVQRRFPSMKWSSGVDLKRGPNSIQASLYVLEEGQWRKVAEAWSLSKKLAQQYIARAVLSINGIDILDSKFSVSDKIEIFETDSWAEEVEAETNPRRAPPIVDPVEVVDETLYRELHHLYPNVLPKHIRFICSIVKPGADFSQKVDDLLSKLQRRNEEEDSSDSGHQSGSVDSFRTSKLNEHQRKRRNRKTLERRKRQKLLSQSPNH